MAKDKITTKVKETRPPNCLTGSDNNSFNLLSGGGTGKICQ